nr:reverse transcriptase domain-containing protein [Tanacetum cinerariifolium]
EDKPEVTLPPQKKLGITLGPGYEVGESSSAAAARPVGGLRADYGFLLAGRLNMLFRDRRAHAYTRHLMETEARLSREAWVRSTDASDLIRGEETAVILEMLRADHRRSTEIIELRTALQGQKQMAPKRTTRSTADQETINATSVTNAQLQAMIDQGVTIVLAARTEGVASLSQWFKRMESVFHRSNCAVENQVKFATCTLHSVALPWWNTHVKTVGHDAAYGMPWKTLMKMMTDKYYPRNEIKKLEMELWDLKVKGTDLASYTQRYQELALLCGRMFSEESDKIENIAEVFPT